MNIYIILPPGEDPAPITTKWDADGIDYHFSMVECFSVNASDYAIFLISSGIINASITAVGVWLSAKQGRRVSIRIGNEEFVANNVDELKKVVEIAKEVRPPVSPSSPLPASAHIQEEAATIIPAPTQLSPI